MTEPGFVRAHARIIPSICFPDDLLGGRLRTVSERSRGANALCWATTVVIAMTH